jgi:tetratricopeptide (TPR) repeat protein
MALTAMDSGWFLPLPKPGLVEADYRPSLTESARLLFARIERDPDDAEAVEALADHYTTAGDQPSLANLMEGWARQRALAGDVAEAAAAAVRAADAALAGTGDLKRAAHLLKRAVAHVPTHERALRELHALLATTRQHAEARKWLEFVADALARQGQPSRYRARVCYRLARLLEEDLKQPEAALARYAESLREDNAYQPARNALLRLQAPAPAGAVPPSPAPQAQERVSVDELRERLRARRPSRPQPSAPAAVDSLIRMPAAVLVSDEVLGAGDQEHELFEVNLGPTTESNIYTGFSDDPLRAGVFLATYRQLRVGAELQLLITFPGALSARAAGRVRFVHDGLLDDTPPGVGAQLTKLTPACSALITRFIAQREPLFYSD